MSFNFLPTSPGEMQKKNWNELDIILVTGDAYVDHPAFGTAVIGRVLESKGYKVGIISMPDWTNPESVKILGKPKLFFGVTSGNVESMISKYTAFKKPRSDDPYAPGGKSGHRPNRALIVYCNLIKQAFNDVPIVIGGLEASMRRVAHYDYWSNKVRRNILADTRADILVYGMGEMQIATIAERLKNQEPLTAIPGTVVFSKDLNSLKNTYLDLPSEQQVIESKVTFLEFCRKFFRHQQKTLVQKSGTRYLVHNSPPAITTNELDNIYDLPFQRKPHPSYEKPVPAFDMIKNSITAHRGCVSGCSFCSLSLHQGKRIISRSESSVLKEVSKISQAGYFKGHITDIGGPSANMYGFQCKINWQCPRESCTFPNLCKKPDVGQ